VDILESVMVCLLSALVVATVAARSVGNDSRDVGLLAAFTALWGAGTAAAVLMG
jgi:hypothetical protein